ncbi:MAG: hypothetical protein QMB40_11700 [Aeromonadaceae bacterium]
MMFKNQRGEEVHLADNLTLKELAEMGMSIQLEEQSDNESTRFGRTKGWRKNRRSRAEPDRGKTCSQNPIARSGFCLCAAGGGIAPVLDEMLWKFHNLD